MPVIHLMSQYFDYERPTFSRINLGRGQQQRQLWRDRFFEERDLHQLVLDGPACPRCSGPHQGEAGLRRVRGVGATLRAMEEGVGNEVPAQKG